MRRRRDDTEMSLDSLMDILSNVVGVMILIAVLSVLGSGDIKISLGTPVVRDAPQDAQRVYFECRGNRLVHLDEAQLSRAVDELRQGRNLGARQLAALLNENDVGDANYRVTARLRGGALIRVFEPRREEIGESVGQIKLPEADFLKRLDSLDPKKNYLYFIVRSDSFEIFRAARRIARERELASGWHPLTPDQPLEVSSSGLGAQVQ